jgi:hypothetical protein
MDLSDRIEAFAKLGEYLEENLKDLEETFLPPDFPGEELFADPRLQRIAEEAEKLNPWFIPAFIHHALAEISRILKRDSLGEWTGRYPREKFHHGTPRVVGTILAGNIPLVGFHDFLAILVSGHLFKGKLSGKDDRLLPFLADKLIAFEPGFAPLVRFEETGLGSIDAMIATGSNNTFRYFEYYFGKYPHIFRKNRSGVAILDGKETDRELSALADDVFLYFGLGCRSIAKLYIPEGYPFDGLFKAMEKYGKITDHHKYANNYQYQRSVFLMNRVEHLDNGFLLLRKDPAVSSPVGTLHYEWYTEREDPVAWLQGRKDSIQCVAGRETPDVPAVPFGRTQHPELWDYADNEDTLNFLINL